MKELVQDEIGRAMRAMFPHGAGRTTSVRVEHWLDKVGHQAFEYGKAWALLGVMTAEDVADHFSITPRRARALIQNRHERFGIGMKAGNTWIVHRDELEGLQPDKKYG